MRELPQPAHGIQAFDLGPTLFRDYRAWLREGEGKRAVVHRVVAAHLVLVFWRDV